MEDSSIVDEAFRLEFVSECNVGVLYEALQVVLQEPTFARIASLLQSSGWGKSRTICELHRKNVWVVYCSLQPGGGYPKKSYIADWFCERARRDLNIDLRGQLECMAFCLAFIMACCEQVAKVAAEGLDEATFVGSLYRCNETGRKFWEQVKSRITCRYPSLLSRLDTRYDPQGDRKNNFYAWQAEAQKIMQEVVRFLPGKKGQLRLVLVFDEARALLGDGIDSNIFLPLRRATGALEQGDGVLALFSDTHSRITNLASPDWLDPSDRLALEALTLASPIWACFCADIGVKQWADVCAACKIDPGVLSEYHPLQYGRPLWWAVFRGALAQGWLPHNAHLKVINMARNKLLGGGTAWLKHIVNKKPLTETSALAVLGARCAIDIDPTCSLASKLVEAHLMTVVKVAPDREHIWVGMAMEPVLAQVASDVMRKLDAQNRSVELYSQLVGVLMAGKIDRGCKGELLARIILLRAFDQASGGQSFCTVDKFIEHLVGKSLTDFAEYGKRKPRGGRKKVQLQEARSLNTEQLKKVALGKLTFTSFHKIHKPSYKMHSGDMKECFQRRCAIICYDGTWGVDLFLPCLLEDGQLTLLHVQVKLRNNNPGDAGLAKVSPQYCGVEMSDEVPFLSIYMNVGDIMGAEAALVDPRDVEAALRKNKKTEALHQAITKHDAAKEQAAKASEPEEELKEEVEEIDESVEQDDEPDEVQLEARIDLESVEQKQEEFRLYKAWLAWLNMERDNQVILKVTGLGAFDGVLGKQLLHLFREAIHNNRKIPMLDEGNALEKIQGPPLQSMFPVVNILKKQI